MTTLWALILWIPIVAWGNSQTQLHGLLLPDPPPAPSRRRPLESVRPEAPAAGPSYIDRAYEPSPEEQVERAPLNEVFAAAAGDFFLSGENLSSPLMKLNNDRVKALNGAIETTFSVANDVKLRSGLKSVLGVFSDSDKNIPINQDKAADAFAQLLTRRYTDSVVAALREDAVLSETKEGLALANLVERYKSKDAAIKNGAIREIEQRFGKNAMKMIEAREKERQDFIKAINTGDVGAGVLQNISGERWKDWASHLKATGKTGILDRLQTALGLEKAEFDKIFEGDAADVKKKLDEARTAAVAKKEKAETDKKSSEGAPPAPEGAPPAEAAPSVN